MTLVATVVKSGTLREGANGLAVKEIQQALRAAGHEIVVDGDFGATTRAAVERFQAASHIAADGMVGPVTAAYLDRIPALSSDKPLPSVLAVAPWLSRARALTGTREIPGARSNPLILSWRAALSAKWPVLRPNIDWYVNDDVPWCGLGCASFVGLCDPGFMPPLELLRALAWADWGQHLDGPVQGAIAVKARVGGGHVTLVDGMSKDGKKLLCRGANQHNMINLAEYPIEVFKTYRWPTGAALPAMKRPPVMTVADLAKNVSEA